jgi:hypothetical protein
MIPSISSDVKEPSMFNAFIPDTRSVAVTFPGFPELIISNCTSHKTPNQTMQLRIRISELEKPHLE